MRQRQSQAPIADLAKTINVNINMTINQYGTIDHKRANGKPDKKTAHRHDTSMETLFDDLQVSNPAAGGGTLAADDGGRISAEDAGHLNQSELGLRALMREGEDLEGAKKRIKKQIRVSKRQMLEPLKVVSKFPHLTQSHSQGRKQQEEAELQQYESLLDMSEKMGQ